MKSFLKQLDRTCEAINRYLLAVAIGLAILVTMFAIVRLAPPAPPPPAWSVQ